MTTFKKGSVAFWRSKGDCEDFHRVFAFDLDSTLVYPKSGAKFARGASDWTWQTADTRELVRQAAKYATIVIFTNQGGVVPKADKKSFINLEGRIKQVLKDLDLPGVRVYAACKNSDTLIYRKPNSGMWDIFKKDIDFTPDIEASIFVGDAAGRPRDHSDCDLMFAKNVGLRFLTPEDFRAEFAISKQENGSKPELKEEEAPHTAITKKATRQRSFDSPEDDHLVKKANHAPSI